MGKREPYYGPVYRIARQIVRIYLGKHQIYYRENLRTPAIYVSRHQNMHGPVHTMAFLPTPVHIWSMYMFLDRKACQAHFRDFTFTARFGWPRWKASLVAGLISLPVSACLKSMSAIPVYRGQREVMKTFSSSLDTLVRGESLVIFPDIMYADTSDQAGAFYTGYLHLARSYHKKTGKELPIVPLYCTQSSRKLILGEPIIFSSQAPFYAERDRVAAAVHESLDELSRIWENPPAEKGEALEQNRIS